VPDCLTCWPEHAAPIPPPCPARSRRGGGARRREVLDDDVQLALFCLYELHYGGLAGVDDRWFRTEPPGPRDDSNPAGPSAGGA
jgi:hypothetical protein